MTQSNPLTWSNLGQPWSSPQKPSQQSPMTILSKPTHLGMVKTLVNRVKPLVSTPCSGTFATFSKTYLNTQKSANIKVVQNFMGHISSLEWHSKFGKEMAQKCKSNSFSLFTSAMKDNNFCLQFMLKLLLKT
jgi:hypothetical protein